MVGAPMSIVITFLSDKYNRKSVLLTISLSCHLSCLFVSFSKSYLPFLVWRGFSGACVISSLPIYLSILGDIFPPAIRSTATFISSTIVGFGMLAGQTVSGLLSSRYGWRFFFSIIPLFGILSAVFLYCMT